MKQITEKESERILWILDTLDYINRKMDEFPKPFPIIYEFDGEKYYKNLPTQYSWKAQTRFEFHPKYQPFGEYLSFYQMIEDKKAEFPYGASIVWDYSHSGEDRYQYYRLSNDRIDMVLLSRYGEQVDEVKTLLKFDETLLKWVKDGLDLNQSPYAHVGESLFKMTMLANATNGILYEAVPHLGKIKKDIASSVDEDLDKQNIY